MYTNREVLYMYTNRRCYNMYIGDPICIGYEVTVHIVHLYGMYVHNYSKDI